MASRAVSLGTNPANHVAELLDAVKSCAPRDTLIIDGECHVFAFPHIVKPVSLAGTFIVHGEAAITVGPTLPEPQYATGCNVQSFTAGSGSITYTPSPTFQPIAKVGDYVFVWSEDALTGVVPHMGPQTIQCPGECHRVVEVEQKLDARGTERLWLDGPTLDAMTKNVKMVVMDLSPWRGLEWDVTIHGEDRTAGRCAVFQGLPEASLIVTTALAGDVAVQCPDVHVDATVRGQVDEANHYGVVLGPWAKDFRLVGSGYGCRHVQTTSGLPLMVGGRMCQCGTMSGTVSMDVVGRYNSPLDTHASGRWITYDRCDVTILPTPRNDGGVGVKVRARDTLIRDSVIRGSDNTRAGMIGIESWATGCKYAGVGFRNLWMSTKTSGPGTIGAGV